MGKIVKKEKEISLFASVKEFLDFPVPVYKENIPLGYLMAIAVKKKLEDLDQVPFHLSKVNIEIEDKQIKVTFRLPE